MSASAAALKPRKSPVQARSAATIAALHMATIQVLTREGFARCTTTRVAARAGMSVGSLYQYYPNRDALLAAVLEAHLEEVAAAVEQACRALAGEPVARMAAGLVAAFLAVKLRDPLVSKALYAIAAGHGGERLTARGRMRTVTALTALLKTAPDRQFDDAQMSAAVAFNAMAGAVRALLEGHAPPGYAAALPDELTRLVGAYLQAGSPA